MRKNVIPREIVHSHCRENDNWIDNTFREERKEPLKLPGQAQIVFATMTSSHSSIFKNFKNDTVFLDEASQVPLYRAVTIFGKYVTRVVLAGDHMQLPGLTSPAGGKAKLDVSLMEKMINQGFETTFLNTQRRGHPDIFAFSSKHIYGGALKSDYNPLSLSDRSLSPVIIHSVEGIE
jgi:superfamily I DNA and/or RNA helicase